MKEGKVGEVTGLLFFIKEKGVKSKGTIHCVSTRFHDELLRRCFFTGSALPISHTPPRLRLGENDKQNNEKNCIVLHEVWCLSAFRKLCSIIVEF